MNITACKNYGYGVINALLLLAIFGYCSDIHAGDDCRLVSAEADKAVVLTPYAELLREHQYGDREALRVREDAKRHRLWLLMTANVYVYDTRKLILVRKIKLPNWSVADIMCPPDMVLDERGMAFVSNNVQPRLLQIDPIRFEKKEHRLRLISKRKDWEIGFGALAFGPDGSLFGLTALAGALFKIDLGSETAREIVLSGPAIGSSALTNPTPIHLRAQLRTVLLCVGPRNRSRRVHVSSDLTQGHMTNEFCDNEMRP